MITKYFTSAIVRMPPAGHAAKLARVFLAQIPPRQRTDIDVQFKLLNPTETAVPEIKVKFKDGTLLDVDPLTTSTREMVETFDRHSRKLQVEDALKE
ncbi:54S ribosomal protein L44, mitochondrial [Wickerhamiella sorbophila]|uniref:Large ribosomal subunit protein mL53 n=1 Tax=Wickerhamiella sorbophila TaxID=45607 RepID=A0A2T0FIR3_9ASCO|nr:54S ribosomal protein L44, mitochondrial [Wickerhamiella sorbophila]PRT54894.1 54S ribosomal protein L44, mitochondrial [Wickerhamiella sorbophila]